jgi:site-specific DNA recombinase
MMTDVKSGRITGLIFSKLARLARDTRELLDFADFFNDHKADMVSLQESIDTSTPAGRLFYTMISAMAQWEREEISSRVAASVPIRAKLGKPLGGAASFGYKWEGKQLVVDEKEAPVRRLIYDIFQKHKRKRTTASELNKLGYRTRNGSKFSDTTVDRLIKDPTAKGERIANYTKSLGEGKKWIVKPQSEWVVTACPTIVSPELWNECNRILEEQEQKRRKPGPKPVHLLSGIIHCSCGKKMYVFHKTNIYTCKPCKNRISVTDIDEIYYGQLKSFLFTDKDVQSYLTKTNSMITEKETILKRQTEEAERIRKEMNELVRMRLSKEMSSESFPRHYKPLEERLNQIDDHLPILQAEVDFLKIQTLSSNSVIDEAKTLYHRWPQMDLDEKRTIVEVITDKISVGREDIEIKLSYLPNSGNMQRNFTGSWRPPT